MANKLYRAAIEPNGDTTWNIITIVPHDNSVTSSEQRILVLTLSEMFMNLTLYNADVQDILSFAQTENELVYYTNKTSDSVEVVPLESNGNVQIKLDDGNWQSDFIISGLQGTGIHTIYIKDDTNEYTEIVNM